MRKGYIPCSTECLCIGCADLCATPCRRTFPGPAAGCSQHSRRNRARTRNPTTCSETNLAGKIPLSRTGKMNLVYQIHCRKAGWTNLVQQIPSSRAGKMNLVHQPPCCGAGWANLVGKIRSSRAGRTNLAQQIPCRMSRKADFVGRTVAPEQCGRFKWCLKALFRLYGHFKRWLMAFLEPCGRFKRRLGVLFGLCGHFKRCFKALPEPCGRFKGRLRPFPELCGHFKRR